MARRPKKEKVKSVPSRSQVYVNPLTQGQKGLIHAILTNDIVFCAGAAGSGKTHISVGMAVQHLMEKQISKIVITRPSVYEGKGIGYLPGDIIEKMAPFLMPIYDELKKFIDIGTLSGIVGRGGHTSNPPIEIVPIEFIRGRTVNGWIIVDEAQNATFAQLKNIVTRIGKGGKIVLNGDPFQSDLINEKSGFVPMMDKLTGIDKIKMVHLEKSDIVRHEIIEKILHKLEDHKSV